MVPSAAGSEAPCHLATCGSTQAGTRIGHPGGRGDRGGGGRLRARLASLRLLWGVLWHRGVEAFEFREGLKCAFGGSGPSRAP